VPQHGDAVLGGPVWWFVTIFILVSVVLALFVLFDSLTPRRRAAVAGRVREPLWLYAAVQAFFLVSLVLAQVLSGVSLSSAIPVIAAPISFATGIVYLLRVVYPKQV
jgi:hypothetical protein